MKRIPLTKGYNAIVDDADYDRVVARGPWYAHVSRGKAYGWRTETVDGRKVGIPMHRFILGDLTTEVDHVDGDSLNNSRRNLRRASHAENLRNQRPNRANTTGYKGVRFKRGRWYAYIKIDGKQIHLGVYSNPAQAARARDQAAVELHGAFASLNFPGERGAA